VPPHRSRQSKVTFSEDGWEGYLYWQAEDRKNLKRINQLVEDIARNGNEGIGKPEPTRISTDRAPSSSRGTGTIEADFLNGEIVLLGRTHGVPTAVNETLQKMANQAARERLAPGTVDPREILSAAAGR